MLFPKQAAAVLCAFGLSLGQEIYTPLNTLRNDFLPLERPYAGWLFFGAEYQLVTRTWRLSLGFSLGLVGRYSFAQDVQQLWHQLIRLFSPRTARGAGWAYQLPHEITAQASLSWELSLLEAQRGVRRWTALSLQVDAALGHARIHPQLWLKWQLGWLPQWSLTPVLRRATTNGQGRAAPLPWHLVFFVEAFGRVVLRDLFLDGSTFVKSHRIERYPGVAGVEIGLDWALGTFHMRFGVVLQTLDAPYALIGYRDHKFARLMLAYRRPFIRR